jgi:cyclase
VGTWQLERLTTFVPRNQLSDRVSRAVACGAGEILVQSVERDGTGKGLDLDLAVLADTRAAPLILMGGVGHADHLVEGMLEFSVDAIATANLFNFIGDALVNARHYVGRQGVPLAQWSSKGISELRRSLST